MARNTLKYLVWIVAGIALVFVLLYLHDKTTTRLKASGKVTNLFMGFEKEEEPTGVYGIEFAEFDKKQITNRKAAEGERSLFVPKEKLYQNLATISEKRENHYFSITLKCNHEADPLLVAQAKDKLYEVSKIITQSGAWKTIRTTLFIPPNLKEKNIQIYIWNKRKQNVWIDSLAIHSSPQKSYPEYDSLQTVHLLINDEPLYKLKNARKLAFEEGNIVDESKKEYSALLNTGGKLNDINIRLKGDWLDHLRGDKWSFRIEMNDDSWKGMREFSIQSPHTRNFLREWFLHKIAHDEGLLTTRYGFVGVHLNGESKGIYAYEEHFKKQLVESSSHREGPIIKMDESEFWLNVNNDLPGNLAYETCEIRAFGEKKIRKSPALWQQFDLAQNLVKHYRWLSAPASEIFDIDKTARSFALLDCMYAKHGFLWHNQRFYYNPVISRLQPIVFDCYGTGEPFDSNSNIFGRGLTLPNKVIFKRNNHLFKDSLFRKAYFDAVKEYSDPAFLDNYLEKYDADITRYEKMIQQEFPYYSFDVSVFRKRSGQLRDSLGNFIRQFSSNKLPEAYAKLDVNLPGPAVNTNDKVNIQHCVNAFSGQKDSVSIFLITDNEVVFTGFGNENRRRTDITKQPEFEQTSVYRTASIAYPDVDYEYLYFETKTGDEMSVKIINLPVPGNYNPRTKLSKSFQIDTSYLNSDNQYVIKSGTHRFSKPVIIPDNSELIIEAGADIHFSEQAGLISFSPVNIKGEPDNVVNIQAEDTISGYFIVLGADDKSFVNHCSFKNQNTLKYAGWVLTGAVTFYESEVEITNASFINNYSEDALNIIRSEFDVSDCTFFGTFSDGFDSDFCKGNLTNSHFENTGNDAIDFSGSQISISDCNMTQVGDKAVSGGEASTLTLKNITINEAVTGISSKDLSNVTGTNVSISNVTYGVLLLEKKPEYGPATLTLKDSKIKSATHTYLIERGSVFVYNKRNIKGNKQNLKAVFY